MLNSDAKLAEQVFSPDLEKAATRDGFGTGAVEAGRTDERVVVLCADVAESTRAQAFKKAFPDRFVEVGVAEQNMAGVASGMAAVGKVPFIASYAAFSPGRNYEQIRTTIALNRANVKVCGMHAGVSVGPDGATHQMLEDIGMMRMLPGMTVLVPADAEEARKAVIAAAQMEGPVYIRFGRAPVATFTTAKTPFSIGKALTLWDSENPEVAIFSAGSLSYQALVAARALAANSMPDLGCPTSDVGHPRSYIESVVVHFSTVKPLDTDAILAAAKRAGRVITIEEHQIAGGFGSAIAECLAEHHPVPLKRLGVEDQFGQSGSPEELLKKSGLDVLHIQEAIRSFVRLY